MTDTFLVIIGDGFWRSCYEPHDMPGGYVRTRYTLKPLDGSSLPPDRMNYRGLIPKTNILRLVSGGEFAFGTTINQELRDFEVVFDESYHDEFYAGYSRAYKGKRRMSRYHLLNRSPQWQDGYEEGLRAKREHAATLSNSNAV
jgi:hypothetical protein